MNVTPAPTTAAVDPNAAPAESEKPAPVEAAPLSLDPPKPAEVPDPASDVTYDYAPTGDVGLDLALNFIGGLGFGPDHPAIKAATTGDFTKVEEQMKKLGDKAKGHERFLQAAKESYERRAVATKTLEDTTAKAVHAAVGGIENWNAIQAFAAANADPAEKAQINAAFKAGGVAAVSVAKELLGYWKASGESKVAPKAVLKDGAEKVVSTTSGPLDQRGFVDEFKALERKHGRKARGTAEYATLVQRFNAGTKTK